MHLLAYVYDNSTSHSETLWNWSTRAQTHKPEVKLLQSTHITRFTLDVLWISYVVHMFVRLRHPQCNQIVSSHFFAPPLSVCHFSYVSHIPNSFIYFILNGKAILLFQAKEGQKWVDSNRPSSPSHHLPSPNLRLSTLVLLLFFSFPVLFSFSRSSYIGFTVTFIRAYLWQHWASRLSRVRDLQFLNALLFAILCAFSIGFGELGLHVMVKKYCTYL